MLIVQRNNNKPFLNRLKARVEACNGNVKLATGVTKPTYNDWLLHENDGNKTYQFSSFEKVSAATGMSINALLDPNEVVSIRPTLVNERAPTRRYQFSLFN